jgi:ketosteroid isomerase-like protein
MNRVIMPLACAAAMLLASPASMAGENPEVAAEVMALARGQWNADIAGKSVAEQTASVADDYTEFNPMFPVRIDGKALSNSLYEAQLRSGDKSIASDMLNAKVQVYGDVAILTYNFVGVNQKKDGSTETQLAKSTRVYAKQGGAWKLVHANFAPVVAPQN